MKIIFQFIVATLPIVGLTGCGGADSEVLQQSVDVDVPVEFTENSTTWQKAESNSL